MCDQSRLKYSFAAAPNVSQRGRIKLSGENEVMLSWFAYWDVHRQQEYYESWNVPAASKRFHNLKSEGFKAKRVIGYSSKQSRFLTLTPQSCSCKWANRRVVGAAPWTHNKSPPEHFKPYFRDPRPVLSASAWRNAAAQLNDPVKLAQT